jgi:hypothetical protein
MASRAFNRLLDARERRIKSQVAANITRAMGWPIPSTTNNYGSWTSGDPVGLARPPEVFTDGGFAPVAPVRPAIIDQPQGDLPRPGPRRWEYPPAWNMPTPPGTEGVRLVPFSTLRAYSVMSTLVRACINKRVEEIVGLEWDIVPTANKAAEMTDPGKRDEFNARRELALQFFAKPDPYYDTFHSWLKAVLEDIFVTDALSIYLAPRLDGDPDKGLFGSPLAGLMLIAGETIRPMVDLHGGRPQPPAVAYQQYIWGVPRVDFIDAITQEEMDDELPEDAKVADLMGDQLLYLPYNKRTNSPYGLSHVEQCLLPIGIELNKQNYVLKYFTEGNLPASWVTVGNVDTPQQVRQWQDTLDALVGDIAARHQVFVLPHGSSANETKPNILRDEYDSTNRETIFAVFGLTAQEMGFLPGGKSGGLTGGSGIASQQQDISSRTATKPLIMFLKRNIFDLVLQKICGQTDMQWQWTGLEPSQDEMQQVQEDVQFVSAGIYTRDEIRRRRGLMPFDLPLTQEPTVTTPSAGVTSLAGSPSGGTAMDGTAMGNAMVQAQQQQGEDDDGKPGQGKPGSKPGDKPANDQAKPNAGPQSQNRDSNVKTPPANKAMLDELRQLRNYLRHGRPLEKFERTALPANLMQLIRENLHKGTSVALQEAEFEVMRSADLLYTSTASAIARAIRDMRAGGLTPEVARMRIEKIMVEGIKERGKSIPHDIHDIASAMSTAESTPVILDQLRRYYELIRPQMDVAYVPDIINKGHTEDMSRNSDLIMAIGKVIEVANKGEAHYDDDDRLEKAITALTETMATMAKRPVMAEGAIQVNVPQQLPPIVRVPAPIVNVDAPRVAAPIVNVDAPKIEVPAPQVTLQPKFEVTTPNVEVPTPKVEVHLPQQVERKRTTTSTQKFITDEDGKIIGAETVSEETED